MAFPLPLPAKHGVEKFSCIRITRVNERDPGRQFYHHWNSRVLTFAIQQPFPIFASSGNAPCTGLFIRSWERFYKMFPRVPQAVGLYCSCLSKQGELSGNILLSTWWITLYNCKWKLIYVHGSSTDGERVECRPRVSKILRRLVDQSCIISSWFWKYLVLVRTEKL